MAKSNIQNSSHVYILGFLGLVIFLAAYFVAPAVFSVEYRAGENKQNNAGAVDGGAGHKGADNRGVSGALETKPVTHIQTPDAVKAIYMSQCVVGTKDFRAELVRLADTTEINSIVIDIKDYTGKISFTPEGRAVAEYPELLDVVSDECGATDMKGFIATLHEKGIYVIGRITVFQDPYMTKKYPERAVKSKATGGVWKDHKGLSFIDVSSREHWDYIVALSKASYDIGFDELNFDYIRYPSDGNMKDTVFALKPGETKAEGLREFFEYLHAKLEPLDVVTSADLFGMTTTNTDDLNIGQVLENALPYFDYIAPMVYPSHYPKGFHNYDNPNKNVYGVIHFAMASAVERVKEFYDLVPPPATAHMASGGTSTPPSPPSSGADSWVAPPPDVVAKTINKMRPWLQDFDYGGNYDVAEVKAQIQATYDVGLNSWMLWAPSNKYTVGALEVE